MHMIPPATAVTKYALLPDGPQRLAATFAAGRTANKSVRQSAEVWLASTSHGVGGLDPAMKALAWAHILPDLASKIEPTVWQGLCDKLVALSNEASKIDLLERPLAHQLLGGELSWTLAARLTDSRLAGRLAKSGRSAFGLALNELLDRDGMLPAAHLALVRPLLACWTRGRTLAQSLPNGGWGARSEQRYQRFVQTAMRLMRPDGRPTFCISDTEPWGRELFDAALADRSHEINHQIAKLALPTAKASTGKKAKKAKKGAGLPSPAVHCEKAGVAVLRPDWLRDGERLTVLFTGETCRIELACSGQVALSGEWNFEVARRGAVLRPVSSWESSCWHCDDDVDYLELEITLEGGVRMERQIALARRDHFLLLADAVLSNEPNDLAYRGTLPLMPGVEFAPSADTNEAYLTHRKAKSDRAASGRPIAQILPLALPEWRTETRAGELSAESHLLHLRQSSDGRRIFAPLFIDLDRSRFRRRMTWRQVHVAESLTNLPADVAAGYRVAIGGEQWLIYRSLAAKSNRTLLGHNLSTESLVARFGSDGEITPIVEIE